MLRLREGQDLFPDERVSVNPIVRGDGDPWRPERDADVLVLGDSFSNIYSLESMEWGRFAGFVEQLSFELKRPCDRIVMNDDGSFATREALNRALARGEDRLAGKKVVVWQFAMRELSQGDWRSFPMVLGKAE